MSSLTLPKLLNLPPKLLPIITNLDNYRYFLIEGGRGSAKSHSVARLLLYLNDKYRLRTVCGREIQGSIDESVHALLNDLVVGYSLTYEVLAREIRHNDNGSEINFRGFRDVGGTNARGMEGVDILWIDEAQQLTHNTIKDVLPTIREEKAKIFFTMNRHLVDDPIRVAMLGRSDCLHIEINYNDNPFCPRVLVAEAEELKSRNLDEYNHVWLNQPLQQEDDWLFPQSVVRPNVGVDVPYDRLIRRVIGIDFAAGGDKCVACIIDKINHQHWRVEKVLSWREPDTTSSIGRIVNIVAEMKPDIGIMDVGGLGLTAQQRLQEIGCKIHAFNGALPTLADKYGNVRAHAYYAVRQWFEDKQLVIPEKERELIRQLELIKMRYVSSGKRYILEKPALRKIMGCSPDEADALAMAVYAATTMLLDGVALANNPNSGRVRVIKRTGRR